jgi:hypothetical protein
MRGLLGKGGAPERRTRIEMEKPREAAASSAQRQHDRREQNPTSGNETRGVLG